MSPVKAPRQILIRSESLLLVWWTKDPFSGLALAGVVIAILLQSEDLRAQEKAIELQTSEMKDTTEALEKQTELLVEQVRHGVTQEFDTRYFELLRFARSGWDHLDCHFPNGVQLQGAQAVSGLSGIMRDLMEPSFQRDVDLKHFDKFKKRHGRDYEPASQMMRLTLEIAKSSNRPEFYLSVWKAAFSNEEKWLFGHVLFFAPDGVPPELARAIEDHSMFEGVDAKLPMTKNLGLSPKAFGKSEESNA